MRSPLEFILYDSLRIRDNAWGVISGFGVGVGGSVVVNVVGMRMGVLNRIVSGIYASPLTFWSWLSGTLPTLGVTSQLLLLLYPKAGCNSGSAKKKKKQM